VGFYDDLHVLIEGDEEAQKALHGELAEVAALGRLKPLLIFAGLRTARLEVVPFPISLRRGLKPG
jgi:hypothetical protein